MEYSAVPLFKSHYSLGKSILTLSKAGSSSEDEPDSIFDIAKKLGLGKVTLVEDSISGFLEAYKSSEDAKMGLQFGFRVTVCDSISNKTAESRDREHKVVVFAKDSDGYSKLIKISSVACSDGFYYYPRIDVQTLKSVWDEKHLMMAIPFYDSFIYKNNLTYSICVPEFSFCKPIFFVEDNDLPFDSIIKKRVVEQAGSSNQIIQAQSIYYKDKKDFLSYLTFRCISERTTLNKPELPHCSSEEFCSESFLQKYAS